MTDTKTTGEKTLSVSPTKTLTLKRGVEQGVVRQSFSHGRSKQVVVEKVKRRVVGGEGRAEPTAPVSERAGAAQRGAPARTVAPPPKTSGVVLRELTSEERNAREHALADARAREAEERKIAEEEALRRSSREVAERAEREAAEARKRQEEERRLREVEAKSKAEQAAISRGLVVETEARKAPLAVVGRKAAVPDTEEDEPPRPRRGAGPARPAPAPKPTRPTAEKRRGRLTLVTALTADEERERSVASFRRRTQRLKGHAANEPKEN